jgi:virulence factor Mce-like protein
MSQRRGRQTRRVSRLYLVLGTVTIAVFAILGYVSFTANSGLPLSSSYTVIVAVPNADRLTNSDEVRINGVRVGQVQHIGAVAPRQQAPYARLTLALNPSVGPLPADTRVSIGQASILGDADVDLVRGSSSSTIPSGGSLPLANAHATVQLTDLLDIFNHATSRGIQGSLGALAPALAGRGGDTNTTIGALAQLLGPLNDVSATLSAAPTRLPAFVDASDQLTAAIVPVSTQLASGFAHGGTTFDAIARHAAALAATIETLPPAERAVAGAFTQLDPGLGGLARIAGQLLAPSRLLPVALRATNATLAAGLPALQPIPRFASTLRTALVALRQTATKPLVPGAVRQFVALLQGGAAGIATFESAQIHCNTLGLWGTNFASVWINIGFPGGPNLIPIAVTHLGAQGEILQHAAPSPNAANNYVAHLNGQECEAGNEPFTGKIALGNPPGQQPDSTRSSSPPAGVLAYAAKAGLLTPPEGDK